MVELEELYLARWALRRNQRARRPAQGSLPAVQDGRVDQDDRCGQCEVVSVWLSGHHLSVHSQRNRVRLRSSHSGHCRSLSGQERAHSAASRRARAPPAGQGSRATAYSPPPAPSASRCVALSAKRNGGEKIGDVDSPCARAIRFASPSRAPEPRPTGASPPIASSKSSPPFASSSARHAMHVAPPPRGVDAFDPSKATSCTGGARERPAAPALRGAAGVAATRIAGSHGGGGARP